MDALLRDRLDAQLELAREARAAGDRNAALAAFQAAAELDPDHAGIKSEIATDLRELGRLDDAEAILSELLLADPASMAALIGFGHLKRRQGDRIAALSCFERASRIDPKHVGVRTEIANDLRELGRLDEAETILSELLQASPESLGALIGLGHLKRRQGDRMASLLYFERASRIDPKHAGIKNEIANDLRELGRLDEAETALSELLQLAPDHVGALIGLGHLKRRRGDRPAALAHFQQASRLDPRHTGIRLEIVNDLRELGRPGDAEQALLAALKTDPGNAVLHLQHGVFLRQAGRPEEALQAFEAAADGDPLDLRARIEIANCHRDIGNILAAEAALKAVLAEDLSNIQAAAALSTILIESYRLDEARRILEGVAASPASLEIHLSWARLFRRLEQRAEALRCFDLAARSAPHNLGVALELIDEVRVQGDLGRALDLIDEASRKHVAIEPLLQRGRILRDQGRHDLAFAAFAAAVEQFPQAPQGRLEMAVEYRRLGQPEKSWELLRSILAEHPKHLAALDQKIEHFVLAEDLDSALMACRETIEARRSRHGPYLTAANIAARLGQIATAWSFLADARRFAGNHPEVAATEIELLRYLRKFQEAEARYRGLAEDMATSFPVLVQGIHSAIALHELALAEQRLDRLRPQTAHEAAVVHHLRARIADTAWDQTAAIQHHAEALRITPGNAGIHWELARCHLLLLQPAAARDHLKAHVRLNASAQLLRGSPHNLSQNHMGQMIDEFSLDAALLSELQSLDDLGIDARVIRLSRLVLDNPDHTAAAIALLLALRRSGGLELRAVSGPPAIPRSIIQFWDNPALPDDIRELTESWRGSHPDYAYRLFDRSSASAFLRQHHSAATLAAFYRAREPAQQADIFRLAYLDTLGGFYADCDDRGAAKLDRFVPANARFTCYQEEYGTLGNNFIGATAHHPVIRRALDLAVEAVNRGDDDIIWFSTGPGLLTRAFAQLIAAQPYEYLPTSAIFTLGQLQRHLGLHCPVVYKMTRQHWLKSSFAAKRKAG